MAAKNKQSPSRLPLTTAATEQLLHDLFDGQPNALTAPFTQWLATSKPFAAFAQTYLRKIRKKVRMSREVEETYNLYCELRTAYLLLQESKFALAYEPYGTKQGRSADFAVTFRTHTTVHVEVTRLQTAQLEEAAYPQHVESRRLVDVVCDKFGQLSAGTPNILWVWSESPILLALDLDQVMADLKQRAEQRDDDLSARHHFAKPAAFIRDYQRLSAVMIQSLQTQATSRAYLCWQNRDSKHPLPTQVANLLPALILADTSPAFATNHIS